MLFRSTGFSFPTSMAVDASSNIYVADCFNNAIKKIAPDKTVNLFAGSGDPYVYGIENGNGTAAKFDGPSGVALSSSGILYVADTMNSVIRKVAISNALVTTWVGGKGVNWSSSPDGLGTEATLYQPSGVALDPFGNVIVADSGLNLIRKLDPDGNATTLAGKAKYYGENPVSGHSDGLGSEAAFYGPSAVAVDSEGNIYIADTNNNLIRKMKHF